LAPAADDGAATIDAVVWQNPIVDAAKNKHAAINFKRCFKIIPKALVFE
jgi:hypothetical protein